MEEMQTSSSNVSLIMLFACLVSLFSLIQILSEFACKRFGGIRDAKVARTMSQSIVAYFHAIPACIFSYTLLIRNGDWNVMSPTNLDVGAPNAKAEVAVMIYTLAFMTCDTIFMIIGAPNTLYILHHIGVKVQIGSVLYLGHGGRSILLCLLSGEITNPIQNTWIIVGVLLDAGYKRFFRARQLLTYVVAWELFLLRFIYLPYGGLYVLWKGFLSQPGAGAQAVPYAVRVLWFMVPCAITAGTALFIQGILSEQTQRNKSHTKK